MLPQSWLVFGPQLVSAKALPAPSVSSPAAIDSVSCRGQRAHWVSQVPSGSLSPASPGSGSLSDHCAFSFIPISPPVICPGFHRALALISLLLMSPVSSPQITCPCWEQSGERARGGQSILTPSPFLAL